MSSAESTGGFRPHGGWMDVPPDLQPALEQAITADVIVVGAGFAGLSTALELARRGAKVVLLEQEHAGFGASGRNAGYLMGSLGIEFEYFVGRVGVEQATRIVSFYDAAVAHVEQKLQEYGIDCDYNQSGHIRVGVHPSQEKKIRKDMELGLKLGSQSQFLSQADLRARGIPPAFVVGHAQQTGGTLQPGKYVLGLRRAALNAGVQLYEKTPVLSYSDGAVVTCTTARGSAAAPKLVLATNAYTPQLGLLRDKVMPIRVSAIETAPLSAEQRAALGWPRREGLVTAHRTLESFRLTPHNTLLITTKRLSYVYGGKTPNVPDPVVYSALEQAFRERFPTLRELPIRSCWSGYVSVAFDALPVVGGTGSHQNILYTAGCSGHGLAGQSLMGRLLAEKISGTEPALLSALHHKTPRTIPEPLQWLGLHAVMGLMRMIDERVNRKVRADEAVV